MRLGYSAWDAIAKLRLKLTRRCVSRRSRISFIIHRFLPLLTTAHWVLLPAINLVHPRPIRPCDSLTHDTPWIGFARAQMHLFPRQSIPQGSGFSDDRGLGLAAIEPNGRGVEW